AASSKPRATPPSTPGRPAAAPPPSSTVSRPFSWPLSPPPALSAAGVHPKVAQALARHSTLTLTLDRYTHLGLHDEAAALDRLPELPAADRRPEAASLKATGTEVSATSQGG